MGATTIFDPTATSEYAGFRLGQRQQDINGEEYMYVKAGSAIAAAHVVVVTEAFAANQITAARAGGGDRVAVAKTAIPSGEYGWVSRSGKGDITVNASCAANVGLFTSANSGELDDDHTSQEAIESIVLTAARAASRGTAPAVWDYPSMRAAFSA